MIKHHGSADARVSPEGTRPEGPERTPPPCAPRSSRSGPRRTPRKARSARDPRFTVGVFTPPPRRWQARRALHRGREASGPLRLPHCPLSPPPAPHPCRGSHSHGCPVSLAAECNGQDHHFQVPKLPSGPSSAHKQSCSQAHGGLSPAGPVHWSWEGAGGGRPEGARRPRSCTLAAQPPPGSSRSDVSKRTAPTVIPAAVLPTA